MGRRATLRAKLGKSEFTVCLTTSPAAFQAGERTSAYRQRLRRWKPPGLRRCRCPGFADVWVRLVGDRPGERLQGAVEHLSRQHNGNAKHQDGPLGSIHSHQGGRDQDGGREQEMHEEARLTANAIPRAAEASPNFCRQERVGRALCIREDASGQSELLVYPILNGEFALSNSSVLLTPIRRRRTQARERRAPGPACPWARSGVRWRKFAPTLFRAGSTLNAALTSNDSPPA